MLFQSDSKEKEAHLHDFKCTYKEVRPEEIQACVKAIKDSPIVYLLKFKVRQLSTGTFLLAHAEHLLIKLLKDISRDYRLEAINYSIFVFFRALVLCVSL